MTGADGYNIMRSEKAGPPSDNSPPTYEQATGGHQQPQTEYPKNEPRLHQTCSISHPAGPDPPTSRDNYPETTYPAGNFQTTATYATPPISHVVSTQPAPVLVNNQRPPDYMIPSIIVCFCCFCPTGILAVCFANQANKLTFEGDIEGSFRAASKARNMIILSVLVGIVCFTFTVVQTTLGSLQLT